MSRPKNASTKGVGTVREHSIHIEPDPNGTRAQRRKWQRMYGKQAAAAPEVEVEEADLPCCEPMDEAHTLPNGHAVFCTVEMNRQRG